MRSWFFNRPSRQLVAGTVVSTMVVATATGCFASAEETKKTVEMSESHSGQTSPEPAPTSVPEELSPEIAALYEKYGGYCDAIVDQARERRYALKRAEIEKLAGELQKRTEAAEIQSAALEKWVNRREEFAKQATAKIVEIYANMQPEASAARLQQLDINLAASLLLAIPPRKASPILNEMDEKNAAAITAVMAASARVKDPS